MLKKKARDIILLVMALQQKQLCYSKYKLSSKDVDYIVEDNELKIGKFLPKVGIEIKSVNELNKMNKVYIIIFAWNFIMILYLNLKNIIKIL